MKLVACIYGAAASPLSLTPHPSLYSIQPTNKEHLWSLMTTRKQSCLTHQQLPPTGNRYASGSRHCRQPAKLSSLWSVKAVCLKACIAAVTMLCLHQHCVRSYYAGSHKLYAPIMQRQVGSISCSMQPTNSSYVVNTSYTNTGTAERICDNVLLALVHSVTPA